MALDELNQSLGKENCPESFLEDPVTKTLRGFQDFPEKSIKIMKDLGITYKDLSALNEEDLELFGVNNPELRDEIVAKLSRCPNQEIHFEKYVSEMDKTQYQETVHKKVLDQLKRIDLVLEESQRLHQCDPINFDSLIDGNVYFSTLSRQALEAAKDEVASQSKAFKCCKKINWIYPTIGLTLIGSVILCKTFRF